MAVTCKACVPWWGGSGLLINVSRVAWQMLTGGVKIIMQQAFL